MSDDLNPIERWLRDCLFVECGGDADLLERVGSELTDKNSRALVVAFARHMQFVRKLIKNSSKASTK